MDLFSKFIFFAAWYVDYESLIILTDLLARDNCAKHSITISKTNTLPIQVNLTGTIKNMDKLKMQSLDVTGSNIDKIAQLFPQCVTERRGKDGKTVLGIDFEKLRDELSADVIDDGEERYQFTWPDKKAHAHLANTPTNKTLRPCREESVDFDHTQNLYIEGDNLEVLKVLRETYLGKVKMIYIDPPYNTGNDFVYNDDFSQSAADYQENSGQTDEEGNRMVQNTESNGRFHTDWLNMIYPRLKVAKDLLTEDGVIFISIDDNEIENLRKVCNEIFGEQNFINCFIWNCSTAGGIRPKFASKTHEYVLCYAKTIDKVSTFFAPLSDDAKKMYTQKDLKGLYRDKDFVFKNKSTNSNQKYSIKCPDGEIVRPKDGYIYRFIKSRFEESLNLGLVTFKQTNTGPLVNEKGEQAHWNIYIKKYLGDALGAPSTLIPKEMTSIYNVGTQCVQSLFNGNRVFENVKPVDVVAYFIKMIVTANDTILDFFSGSATTAHAVMQLNAEDGGNRKFIMVQLPEKTDEKSEAYKAGYKNICEIGKERIRRAGRKIKEEAGLQGQDLDIGFRVLKLDSSNMQDVYYTPKEFTEGKLFADNVKEDRSAEDLLFQVMLDLGVELSATIEQRTMDGKQVFFVNDNYLVACFDTDITEETIKEIAKLKPYYFVMRDSSLASDNVADNFDQLFDTYSRDTIRRII